eukprot:4474768-Amphidinium_carterae.1
MVEHVQVGSASQALHSHPLKCGWFQQRSSEPSLAWTLPQPVSHRAWSSTKFTVRRHFRQLAK